MASEDINQWRIGGHLGRDAELRYTASGRPQMTFSVASERHVRQENGDLKPVTDWWDVVVWGRLAEDYSTQLQLDKGAAVIVEGRASKRSWDKDDGTKQWRFELIAARVEVLGQARRRAQQAVRGGGGGQFVPGPDGRGWQQESDIRRPANAVPAGEEIDPDDLPFE